MAKKLSKTPPVAVKSSKPAPAKPKPVAAKSAKPAAIKITAAKPRAVKSIAATSVAAKIVKAKTASPKPAAKPARPVVAAKAVALALTKTPAKKLAAATQSAKSVEKKSSMPVAMPKGKAVVAKAIAKPISSPAMKARAAAATAAPLSPKAPKVAAPVVRPESAVPVAAPLKSARPLAPTKPGVKNGEPVAAKIALKPAVVAALAAERGTPVMKLTKSARPRPEPIPVRLPPAPVRSDSKMARNRAGISSRELEHFRDLLFEKRRELTGDVFSMETSALHNGNGSLSTLPMHMADAGTDNYEQEFTLGLVEKDRKLLRDINVALAKIQDGSYGICEGTGKPIAKPRLEAQPWAKYSIEHARALERPQYRRAF